MSVALRAATPADDPFFARVYASTREQELSVVPFEPSQKAAFLAQQFSAQTAHYAEHYAEASREVILVDGEPAGRLIVDREGDSILIVDIALLPEFRGRGIGTGLLGPILAEGEREGRAVAIHVERMNPALRLYERLGFEPVSDDGIYLLMERRAGAEADR